MKKTLSLFCALVLLLTLPTAAGCNDTPSNGKPQDSAPAYDTPLEQLTTYDTDEFKSYWQGQGPWIIPEEIRNERTFFKLNLEYPVERMVVLSETKIAAIYRLEHNEHVSYAYVIFNAPENKYLAKNYVHWDNMSGEIYYVSKRLSSNDFATLAVGDHISKAVEIDISMACAFREYIDTSSGQYIASQAPEWYSYRLLSDGVLCMTFKAPWAGIHSVDTTDDRCVITAIDFYPYGSTDVPDYISIINYPNLLQEH